MVLNNESTAPSFNLDFAFRLVQYQIKKVLICETSQAGGETNV